MTEHQALRIAKNATERAMAALEQLQGSSCAADEAYDTLLRALISLKRGIRCCRTENGLRSRGEAVDASGSPLGEGAGEGLPNNLPNSCSFHNPVYAAARKKLTPVQT